MKDQASQLAQTLEREKAKFFRFVRTRLSRISAMDAEDIVADVVSGLLRRADVFGEVENGMAYAYRSLENRITDFRRKSRETVSLGDEDGAAAPLAERLASPATGPEGACAGLEMRDRLVWALGRLSARERALADQPVVPQHVIDAFHMMWGPFPEVVLLLHKSRAILAVNDVARAAGVPLGVKCSSLNPENKTDDHCRQCQVLDALRSGEPVEKFSVSGGKRMKGYWLPLKDFPDVYVHFGVSIDQEIDAALAAAHCA